MRVLSRLLRLLPLPEDGKPLRDGEVRAFLAAMVAWRDKAGTGAVAGLERHAEIEADRKVWRG